MSTCPWLSAFALAILLPALQAEPHCPGNVASLRLRLVQQSQIIIPVAINGTGPYNFIVDTGAQVTTVDPGLASELHLTMEGTVGVVGVGFRTHPPFAHLDRLQAGSYTTANPLVVVQDLGYLHVADPAIRGVLGGDFLKHLDVLIDYRHGILCLDGARIMQAEVKGRPLPLVTTLRSDPEVVSTEPLIVAARLSGLAGRTVLLLLDSGVSTPVLYDAGKDLVSGSSLPIRDRGPDGIERVFSILPPQDLQIGTLLFHRISFVTPMVARKDLPKVGVDGLLPTVLFRRVYINYADRFVVLEP